MADSEPEPPAPPPPPPPEPPREQGLLSGLLGSGDEPPPPGKPWRKKLRSEMGFFEHLEELRMTVMKSAMAAFVGMIVMTVFLIKLLDFLRLPLEMTVGQDQASQILYSPQKPHGMAMMLMSVSVFGGVVLALPLIAYFIIRFVAPGLTTREQGILRPTLLAALTLFFAGMEMCFFYMLPAAFKFFIWLDTQLKIQTHWTLDEYYSLVGWACLAMGLVFEFPLILVILQVLDVISPSTLRNNRRFAIVAMLVLGMIIAPSPDPFSMLTTMAPMVVLYEAAIIVGAVLRRRKLAADAQREADNAG